jgi:hypothetical protein
MSDLEERLRREVASAQMSTGQADEVRRQAARFEAKRPDLEREFHGRVVCFIADDQLVGDSLADVVAMAKARFPGRMFYAEPIGFDPFGGAAMTSANA